MKRVFQKIIVLVQIIVFFSFTFPKQAHAYLDPGTNSYLFQIAIASLLGGLFAIKLFFKNIVNFFKDLFKHANKKNST